MKKIYEEPWAEIERFKVKCIITESPNEGGIGEGGEGTSEPDEF